MLVSTISIFSTSKSFAQSDHNSSTVNDTSGDLGTPINLTVVEKNRTDSTNIGLDKINKSLQNGDNAKAIEEYDRTHYNMQVTSQCITTPVTNNFQN